MAVPEPVTPVREALELASRVVAKIEDAELNSGGLIGRPLLRLTGELRQALARISLAPSATEKVAIADPRAMVDGDFGLLP